ncbi:MAG: hypothetical protein WC245_08595 [Bacteroidales bacterium]|jgi:hypothetical protein
MKNYVIFDDVRDQLIKAYILVTSIDDIYFVIDDILTELSKTYGSIFSIIIDHFITNGFSFNRFSRIDYSNGSIKKSLVTSRDINDFYDKNFVEFILNHKNILDESSLSKRTIDIICSEILRI